jgi:hypothetical protein
MNRHDWLITEIDKETLNVCGRHNSLCHDVARFSSAKNSQIKNSETVPLCHISALCNDPPELRRSNAGGKDADFGGELLSLARQVSGRAEHLSGGMASLGRCLTHAIDVHGH